MSFANLRLCLIPSLLLLGCSGTVVEGDGEGGSSNDATSGQTNGQTGPSTSVTTGQGAGDPGAPCPPSVPGPGVGCTDPTLVCSYGSDPRPNCRSFAYCDGMTFGVYEPMCGPEPQVCPDAPPPAIACTGNDGVSCSYDTGTLCICTGCFGGGPCSDMPIWSCSEPAAGCPTFTPNSGTSCASEGQACSYGDACSGSGAEVLCVDGRWQWQQIACPL